MATSITSTTTTAENAAVSVIGVKGNGHLKSKNLSTTLNYYDEAVDKAKKAETIDPSKEEPKIWYPRTPTKGIQATIQDITGHEDSFTLEKHGFQLSRQPNTVITRSEHLRDEAKIKNEYFPHMQEWLKEVTGAQRVKVYHHGVRTSLQEGVVFDRKDWQKHRPAVAPPVYSVHVDQSEKESREIVRRHLSDEAKTLLETKRVMIVNAWRPIKTVYRDPFGIADASTVPDSDYVARPYKFFDQVRETFTVQYNPSHEWYYKYQQTPEEVLIFKGFDTHGNARVCPHSAFVDEDHKSEEVRESIEIRALLIYDL